MLLHGSVGFKCSILFRGSVTGCAHKQAHGWCEEGYPIKMAGMPCPKRVTIMHAKMTACNSTTNQI